MLTIAVHPMRGYAARLGVPPWAGTLVGIVTVYVVLLLLAASLVIAVARFATLMPSYQDKFDELLQSGLDTLAGYGVSRDQINDITSSFDVGQAVSVAGSALNGALSLTSNLLFIITLLLFMGIDAAHLPGKLEAARGERPAVVAALDAFADGTRRYLVVSTVFGLIVAVLDTAFLAFTPVPVPLLWGLLAFITNYIPNIGFVIGLVPPAILGLLEGGPWLMLLIIAVYSVLNFVIQSVIQPKFVGDSVGISGTLTFLSLVFWAWVLGAARGAARGAADAAGQGAAGRRRPRLALAQPAVVREQGRRRTGGDTSRGRCDRAGDVVDRRTGGLRAGRAGAGPARRRAAGAAGQRGLRHGHRRDQQRAAAGGGQPGRSGGPAPGAGRWPRPRLHAGRGARGPAGRAGDRRRAGARAGRLAASRCRAGRHGSCCPTRGWRCGSTTSPRS